ncbi:MAG: hypothetical protein EXS35_12540 [Pedosphaera sp.]|nr:hypothetical protein [Pedosphaera sp.]
MKTSLILCLLLATFLSRGLAAPLSSSVTYQGRLTDAAAPANGEYDLRFSLYDADVGGSQNGLTLTNENLWVTNGLFTTALDFGTNVFNGQALWLEIAVRPGASTDAFTNVTPRQPVTATPYALHALSFSGVLGDAQLAGTYGGVVNFSNAANIFGGSFSGNGGGLTNLNAGTLGGLGSSNFWRTTGNGGTLVANHFLGTTDNQPFEIRVNSSRVLRLEPDTSIQNAPNVIGGSPVNIIAPGIVGATIAGGGSADYEGNGPTPNTVTLSYGTVGGGVGNDTAGVGATIGGGYNNTAIGFFATVAGGGVNVANGDHASVGGGLFNQATNTASTVAGGRNNLALGRYSSVGGGTNVQALGEFSTVAGGRDNIATVSYGTISGGRRNSISGATDATVGGGNDNDITQSLSSTISGGSSNTIALNATNAVIAGGFLNVIQLSSYSVVGGGVGHLVYGSRSGTIGGGEQNDLLGSAYGTISGGRSNSISSFGATIGGGSRNEIESSAHYSVIGGGQSNLISVASPWATINGGVFNRIEFQSTHTFIGGGSGNEIESTAHYSVIGGGQSNLISVASPWAAINGGVFNRIETYSPNTLIGGGSENVILPGADNSVIVGGENNLIETNAGHSFIGGGLGNQIQDSSDYAAIPGGTGNFIQIAADFSTIGGGRINRIGEGAEYATVPGGYFNEANADYSFAAGRQAKADHAGSFVWADSIGVDFGSTGVNQFLIRAAGGVGINVRDPGAPLHVYGAADATLTGGGIAILGNLDSANMVLDGNEIQARNNSAASTLFLNAGGGNVSIGTVSSTARLRVVSATCDGSSWINASDRNLKAGFAPVDARDVLAKVAALPLQSWHYTNAPGARHVGPMAQDFQAAFGLGSDDKSIATVDADGVALAAIQGLNQKVEEQETRLKDKDSEIQELRQAVAELQKGVRQITNKTRE